MDTAGAIPKEAISKRIRLEQDIIESLFKIFNKRLRKYPDAAVYLFGSRVDLEKRGGDLDLLIVSRLAASHAYELGKHIRIDIKEELGDQKIDLLITPNPYESDRPAFFRLALMEGVQIWP
ncbi:MAG: nucleotidyltransferase domain-containing protein [Chloroflexota bacterium]|nr:nucleotidyltransferase domain-containing protein [Chloroflexota bacterium]